MVLFTINIELINITNTCISCSLMFVIAAVPINFILAQLLATFILGLVCLFCELAVAMTLFKILLVTHFDLIFPSDPDQLGHCVLAIAAAMAFLPSAVICIYQTYHGQMISNSVAYLTKNANYSNGIPYMIIYIIFWTVLGIVVMIIALLYIPYYVKKYLNSNAVQIAETGHMRKQVSIGRVLLGFLGLSLCLAVNVIIHRYSLGNRFPLQLYFSVIGLNMMLTYFVLEQEVVMFIKKKILSNIPLFRSLARRRAVSPRIENMRS